MFLLFVWSQHGVAQCCGAKQIMTQQITASTFKMYYSKYEDNPYFINDWSNASITLLSGETYTDLKVKFDLFKGSFIYYNERLKKLLLIDDEIIEKVIFYDENGDVANKFIQYCKKKNSCLFYEDHYSDSISYLTLYKKKIEKYNDVSRSTNYLGGFYLINKELVKIGSDFINLPKSKRALVNMFPSNKKALVSFINKNGLKMKNKKHLVLIFEKINELEKSNPSVYQEYPSWMFWK